MLPDQASNPGPLTYESGALPIALRGPAQYCFPETDLRRLKMLINQQEEHLKLNRGTNVMLMEQFLVAMKHLAMSCFHWVTTDFLCLAFCFCAPAMIVRRH